MAASTATLTFPGAGKVTVKTKDDTTVAELLAMAAEQLGLSRRMLKVSVIVNGEVVAETDLVGENFAGVAAPKVANG